MDQLPISDLRVVAREGAFRRETRHVLAEANFLVGEAFRVRSVRLVEGREGRVEVVMPREPRPVACAACGSTIGCTHRFCKVCGEPNVKLRAPTSATGAPMLYDDTIYPVNHPTRRRVETLVLGAYLAAIGVRPRPHDPTSDPA
jgi:DNA-binding cell septation regulator SpoVG